MEKSNKGWRNESIRHGLSAKGVQTATKKDDSDKLRINPQTPVIDPVVTKKAPAKDYQVTVSNKEKERVMRMFADYNYKYPVTDDYNAVGTYIDKDNIIGLIMEAIPNGCGKFNTEELKKLTELYDQDSQYMISRSDGSVIITVKGEAETHPGLVREWVHAESAMFISDDVMSYKWSPGD
jgi:UDP-glucose 6-dehydrogenase